jgi:hypothetical protein
MKYLYILPVILVLFNCSVQKRKYQKGYYVEWKHHSKVKSGEIAAAAAKAVAETAQVPEFVTEGSRPPGTNLSASAANTGPLRMINDPPCDQLIFNDGSEVAGKITEVSSTEVKYKRCEMPEGPTYTVKKSLLFMIKYANGTREVIKTESPQQEYKSATSRGVKKREHPLAMASLVAGILGIIAFPLIPSILAIAFGSTALNRIQQEPDRYSGQELARIGKVLGIIGVVAALLLILVIFVLLSFIL